MAAAAILIVRIRKMLMADGVQRAETHHHAKSGPSVAETLQFSISQDGHCRHVGFLKSQNFIG